MVQPERDQGNGVYLNLATRHDYTDWYNVQLTIVQSTTNSPARPLALYAGRKDFMDKSPWTEKEIRTYSVFFGIQAAIDLLLMISPERFDGDWGTLYNELIRGLAYGVQQEQV